MNTETTKRRGNGKAPGGVIHLAEDTKPPVNPAAALSTSIHTQNLLKRVGYNVFNSALWTDYMRNPDPALLSHSVKGILLLEEMSRSPVVAACLSALYNPILGMDWEWTAASEDAEDKRRRDAVDSDFRNLNSQLWKGNAYTGGYSAHLQFILEAHRIGYSIPQAIWNISEGRIIETKHHDPNAFMFLPDEGESTGGWNQWTGTRLAYFDGNSSAPQPAPPYKFMHYVWRPRYGNPFGNSALGEIVTPYVCGDVDGLKMYLHFVDKWAQPSIAGLIEKAYWADTTANREYWQRMADQLDAIQTGFRGIFPVMENGQKPFEVVESNRSSSNDIFQNFIGMMHRLVAIGLIGAPLTIMEAEFGTRAQASEQQIVRFDFIKGLADFIMQQMMIFSIWTCDVKFGVSENAQYPTFKLKYEAPKDLKLQSEIDTAGQAMGSKHITQEYYDRTYGVSTPVMDGFDPKQPLVPIAAAPEPPSGLPFSEPRIIQLENPNHDPGDGRFTTGGGSSGGSSGGSGAKSTSTTSGKSRSSIAKAAYNPATKEKQRAGIKQEGIVTRSIGGTNLPDNEPVDVVKGRHAIEVKTIVDSKANQIFMRKSALDRKVKYARKNKMQLHTVLIDSRGQTPKYYYRKGVGSFRTTSMKLIPLSKLKAEFES
jgi:hypothetical protein